VSKETDPRVGSANGPSGSPGSAALCRDDLARLYSAALPATRTGPLYNAFSYPTKISPEAIALFIATHTKPGDAVLDVFAGSGTTGLAAKLCDQPTPAMLALSSGLGLDPAWGPRRAVLYDVSVLGSFIAEVMCNPPDPARFERAAGELVAAAEKTHGWLYHAVDAEGASGVIRHTIWSEVLICPECGIEATYWEATVRHNPLRLERTFQCEACGTTNHVDACERALEVMTDPLLGEQVERRRRVPVMVHGKTGKRRWQRRATEADVAHADRAAREEVPAEAPRVEIAWGDLYRSGYHTGISHLHHFYTARNFLALAVLWELIEQFDEDLRDPLRMLVLSYNASHSTLMTRVVVKQNQKDLVLTGAQSGVLYVSALPVEKNVFEGVRRKAKTLVEAFKLVAGSASTVQIYNESSTDLHLEDGGIDYVFTDPPFGDYIPYAEVNQLNEAWLGALTDRSREIVMSAAEDKDVATYGDLMAQVFAEVARVLAPNGRATVVFHSAHSSVWQALTDAYRGAGLGVRTTSVLDKRQASFKQVVSTTTVKGDPLILLAKQPVEKVGQHLTSTDEVIAAVLADADVATASDERTRERLFSRFITRCLVEGVAVTLGAAEFYARVGIKAAA
jgi:16S rRNA G966 N2-methylase RsmD